ncbi:MAG: pilus assembly protein [Acidimicrobiia bacterium]|nr:pilus assembly protein [Acidimicrobiia bacterium]
MRWRRHDGEKGAALVEMAIVLPLLIVLVFGIVEYGLLFKEKLTIAAATSSAARTGATMGNREAADIRILQALEAGLFDQVDSKVLISVDIFRADPDTGAKIGTEVDSYEFNIELACHWDPCPDPAVDPHTFGDPSGWPPEDRTTTLNAAGGGLDLLGIEVSYHHTAVTGLIPGVDRDLVERALIRLEPDVFEITTPSTP